MVTRVDRIETILPVRDVFSLTWPSESEQLEACNRACENLQRRMVYITIGICGSYHGGNGSTLEDLNENEAMHLLRYLSR